MNINSAINEAIIILKKSSIKTAQLDSEILLAEAINKKREYIILNQNHTINKESYYQFKTLVEKRSKGKPVAYLVGKKDFWKYQFQINEHVLIPRPDTEIIVEQILKISKFKSNLMILDIGVGSGCILVSILKEKLNFYGTGIDVSKNCINISRINAINLKVNSRVRLYKSNVDKFNLGKYDLIVANPPYIIKSDLKYLEKDVVNFEPKLALDGGLDGLSEIRKVIKKSSELVKKNGKFILEIGFNQKNKVINLLKEKGFYINSTLKDLAKNDRCIVSTKI